MHSQEKVLEALLSEHESLHIAEQVDYEKFHIYSLITHSTAIEGSTITEIENIELFDNDIPAIGKPLREQLMNTDLKTAYDNARRLAKAATPLSVPMLCDLSAFVMKNTGSVFNTILGSFDASKGELRKCNVTAGAGGRSYLDYTKVPTYLEAFCKEFNDKIAGAKTPFQQYCISFDAHCKMVTIHPWVDGNGRMARLLMNYVQFQFNLLPTIIKKEERTDYISALRKSQDTDDYLPFREYMLKLHIRHISEEIAEYKKSISHTLPFSQEDI